MKRNILIFLIFLTSLNPAFGLDLRSQELVHNLDGYEPISAHEETFNTSKGFPLLVQKYSGFNLVTKFFFERALRVYLKHQTKAESIKVRVESYSGIDLINRKAKSIDITAKDLIVEDIPVKYLKFKTTSPLYLEKRKSKYKVATPTYANIVVKVDLDKANQVINNLPKWRKLLDEIYLPIPPFGSAKIALSDLNINIDKEGNAKTNAVVKSLVNPESEDLKLDFSGRIVLSDKKIVVKDLQTEIDGLFTKESELSEAFNEVLEEIINPVIDFNKYQKKQLTIDNVKLDFGRNNLKLNFNLGIKPPRKKSIKGNKA